MDRPPRRALILLAAQTGLRASELVGLTCGDLRLGTGAPATGILPGPATTP